MYGAAINADAMNLIGHPVTISDAAGQLIVACNAVLYRGMEGVSAGFQNIKETTIGTTTASVLVNDAVDITVGHYLIDKVRRYEIMEILPEVQGVVYLGLQPSA